MEERGEEEKYSKIDITQLLKENQNLINEKLQLEKQVRNLQQQLRLVTQSPPERFQIEVDKKIGQNVKNDFLSPENQTNLCSYHKRRGTADHGKEYEYLMCAYYSLKFSTANHVLDFQMRTNDDTFGDFDDIMLTAVLNDGTSHTYLFQLKHTENKKNITERLLTAEKGDFSLLKYFRSFQTLKNKKNMSCILFTNRTANVENESAILLQNRVIGVKHCESLPLDDLINTNPTKNYSQFEILEDDDINDEMGEFFEKFFLLSDQSNVAKVKTTISQMLKLLLQAEIYDNFITFMKSWWSQNFVLTKDIVIAKLAELVLSPFILTISDERCNEKTRLLEEAILKFDLTVVKDPDNEIVNRIWRKNYSDWEDIQEIKKIVLNYGLTTKKITSVNQLSANAKSKLLWYLDRVPLVLKIDELKKNQIIAAVKLLEKKKKIVLLGEVGREDFPGWNVFENLSDLVNEEVYVNILSSFDISLQGRDGVSLEKLINFDNDVAKVIEIKELASMTQETVLVGEKEEDLPSSYISRSVTTVFLDTEKVLNNCDHTNDLLIINCDKKFKSVIQVKDIKVLELYDFLEEIKEAPNTPTADNIIVLSTKHKCSKAYFDIICEKICKRNILLIQVIDNKTCILVLSKENPSRLKEMVYKRAPVEENEIYTFFDNPINVICAQPGMGKSTLTTYLSNTCPSHFWSVRLKLKEQNHLLRERPKKEKILAKFLKYDPSDQSFLSKMKGVFLKSKKIYLFLDGLDEIKESCVNLILDYAKYIATSGVHVWICSRKNLEETITNQLNLFPLDIKELNHWQQKKYIYQRLQPMFEPQEVNQIAKNIFNNVEAIHSDSLLGIPLKLFIITENFLDNKELKSDEEIFVLTTMYRIFFEGKKKHQYRKVGVQDEQQLGLSFNLYLEQYEIPALRSCLDKETFAKLDLDLSKNSQFLETIKSRGDKFGIITQIHEFDKAVFGHQTYAEYFACVWLRKNPDKVRLLKDTFFSKRYENLRFMLDIMLAERCPLHLAVIYKNLSQVNKHLNSVFIRDEGGRNPLHLISSYGTKLQPLKESEYNQYITNPQQGEGVVYEEIMKLMSKFDPFDKDHIFNWTSLDYALASQSLSPVEATLCLYKDISLEQCYEVYSSTCLAFYSASLGYQNLLAALFQRDPQLAKRRVGSDDTTLLHVAVKCEHNVEAVKILLEHGADIDARDQCGRTALHWASEHGHHLIIKTLLEEGASVNAVTNNNETILHHATRKWKKSNAEAVDLLVNSGVDVNAGDRLGVTALHLASEKEYYEMVRELLEKGAEVNAVNRQGESVLHYAVKSREPHTKVKLLRSSIYEMINNEELFAAEWTSKQKQYGMVKMLLEKGAKVDVVTKEAETVLHYAAKAWKPNVEVINLLIESGVEVNAKSKHGVTALHRALQKGHYEVVKSLLERGADVTAVSDGEETILHYATRTLRPSTEIIQLLLDGGVDVNAKDSDGFSVLHWAAEEGHYELVKLLVEKGADVNAITSTGVSVLHQASCAWKPNRDVMKLLILAGADVNRRDKNGVSALHWVSEIGFFDVARLLLDKGADVNAVTDKAETVLHYATKARDPNVEVIELLVEGGVDVNAKDRDGITALHWASERGHFDIVKILVENGADINATTNREETVLNYAVRSREAGTAMIKFLVKSGVDVNKKDKDGISALHWVSEAAHFNVVEMLLEKGADVGAVTNRKETVLHYAAIAREDNDDVIKMFLKNGVDVDARNVDGKTALHVAVERGIYENIKQLVEGGASLEAVTAANLTPLHYAVYRGRVEMVQLLLVNNIDLSKIDIYNEKMPLYFAAKDGQLQVDLLLKITDTIYKKFNLCSTTRIMARYLKETSLKQNSPKSMSAPSCQNPVETCHIFTEFYRRISSTTLNQTSRLWDFFSWVSCRRKTSKYNVYDTAALETPSNYTCKCEYSSYHDRSG